MDCAYLNETRLQCFHEKLANHGLYYFISLGLSNHVYTDVSIKRKDKK